jgi:hypothetical protein
MIIRIFGEGQYELPERALASRGRPPRLGHGGAYFVRLVGEHVYPLEEAPDTRDRGSQLLARPFQASGDPVCIGSVGEAGVAVLQAQADKLELLLACGCQIASTPRSLRPRGSTM